MNDSIKRNPPQAVPMESVHRAEKGQSLVELAFSLVLLLTLLAGALDISRAFFTYMSLHDAAQEGAAYASACPNKTTEITNRVRRASSQPIDLADTTHVIVNCYFVADDGTANACPGTSGNPGKSIRIRVTYNDFRITMPFLGALVGHQNYTLRAEATDTILRASCP